MILLLLLQLLNNKCDKTTSFSLSSPATIQVISNVANQDDSYKVIICSVTLTSKELNTIVFRYGKGNNCEIGSAMLMEPIRSKLINFTRVFEPAKSIPYSTNLCFMITQQGNVTGSVQYKLQ